MTAAQLAEAYEKLKELRRKGDSGSSDVRSILDAVRGEFLTLGGHFGTSLSPPQVLLRVIEIKTLADRVFGDPKKAADWLTRSNSGLSSQRPLDLLKDELGAAVLREMLERIDHVSLPELAHGALAHFQLCRSLRNGWVENRRPVAFAGEADCVSRRSSRERLARNVSPYGSRFDSIDVPALADSRRV